MVVGLDNVVCIATHYGLGGPEIESRWGKVFHARPGRPGAHPTSCIMGRWSGWGVALTTFPFKDQGRTKNEALTLLPFLGLRALF
jgi:hypothetical protein